MYTYKPSDDPSRCFYNSSEAQPFPELKDRLAAAANGVPLPDMSYPKEAPEGTSPLLPEERRFVEPADLYDMEQKVGRKLSRVRADIDSIISKGK